MKASKNFVESLSRGMRLLSAVSENPTGLGLTELSDHLHLTKSTIQRLSFTLQSMGYLDRTGDAKKFRLGMKSLSLAHSAVRNTEIRTVAFPFLRELSKEIVQTVNLAMLDGAEIVFLERVKVEDILSINLHVGSRLPAYCSSMGKAMLAWLPEDRLAKVISETDLVARTSRTITRIKDLRKELEKVRARGFAISDEELSTGLRSVAAPVRNYTGEVIAAVNIAVLSMRVSREKLETDLAEKVIKVAAEISSVLGYRSIEDRSAEPTGYQEMPRYADRRRQKH